MKAFPIAPRIASICRTADKFRHQLFLRFGTVLLFAMILISLAVKLLVGKE